MVLQFLCGFSRMVDREQRVDFSHPAWAVLLAGVPLAAGFFRGPLFIDDAYITFRYAANLAAGQGFVYNSEPVLGTTAPLYCLLLAGGELMGAPVPGLALFIGVLSAAAAPVLLWRMGVAAGRPGTGLVAGVCLCLFPHWWLGSKIGMESTLAGALAVLALLLDLRGRAALSGITCGLLVLVRPDAAVLGLLIFITSMGRDRKGALHFALAGSFVLVPWLVFSFIALGSPLPQSLAAKRLVHFFPWYKALMNYGSWFFSMRDPLLMALFSAFFVAGLVFVVKRWRRGLALSLFPPVFILGLSLTQVGPFFWYKTPALPCFLYVSVLGTFASGEWLGERLSFSRSRVAVKSLVLVPLAVVLLQVAASWRWFADSARAERYVAKEVILKEMAKEIAKRAPERAGKVSVFAGEVGVLGFELLDMEIIDSAGINSPGVYEIRKRDWERLKASHPGYGWKEQWFGSPAWSMEVIRKRRPDFIASNIEYLHLSELMKMPWFRSRYELVRTWEHPEGDRFALFERRLTPSRAL